MKPILLPLAAAALLLSVSSCVTKEKYMLAENGRLEALARADRLGSELNLARTDISRLSDQVTRLVQVAVRDFSATEAALAASSERIETFDDLSLSGGRFRGETWDAQCREIVERLPEEVYVSFDIDGLTLENCPHTGTPVCGGLGFNEAVWLLDTLARSGRRIIGFDLVEVAPSPEGRIDAIVGARMLWKLCGLTLKSNNQQNQR